jgi:hypothetical protein
MNPHEYPWYTLVNDMTLEQGDIVEGCPVFSPPEDFHDSATPDEALSTFTWKPEDVIILTQTCDKVEGTKKVNHVLVCHLWNRSDFTEGHFLATPKGMEEARRGNMPGIHLLAASELPGLEHEVRIVDFKRVYSLPIGFLRRRAHFSGNRLRLLPPYREHLSQAFAQFFMRVGLPVNIPPFR